jgi:CBS domain-containing protein
LEEIGRMLVEHILRRKGRRIAIVDPEATIARALEILAQDNIGALPVVRDDRIVGMLSERDVARGLVDRGAALLDTPVTDLMTTRLTTCRPETTIEELMTMMTMRRIRHVPVLGEDGSLAGMISIGDVVKCRLDELETEAQALRDYVAGVQ